MGELLRLCICDGKTGICLFDLVWNENYVVIPTSIGSLISSFYQIAREFGDKGGVSSIRMRPCTHRELFLNSAFGNSLDYLPDPPPPTTRSASFPNVNQTPPLSPRERTSSPPSFLKIPTIQISEEIKSTTSTSSLSGSTTPTYSRAASLPSFVTDSNSTTSSLIHTSEIDPPFSRPALLIANPSLTRSGRSTSALLTDFTDSDNPSNPSTPTIAPSDPFASSQSTPETEFTVSSELDRFKNEEKRESKSAPASPTIQITPPFLPSPPIAPTRASRFIGHHKRGKVKSANAAYIRITLQRDSDSETVVAVMHSDSDHTVEYAKSYSKKVMDEFMEEYRADIGNLRGILDKNTDNPNSSEEVEQFTTRFKHFALRAEKIKSTPHYTCFHLSFAS